MSLMELVVSFFGLVAGYALVSWLMGRGQAGVKPAPGDPPRRDPPRRDPPRPEPAKESWWSVLCVPQGSDLATAKAAYRSLIAQYHPDKVAGMGPEIVAVAEAQSARINTAWEAAQRSFKR
jgi:DnaJ-domain-containing protein 1